MFEIENYIDTDYNIASKKKKIDKGDNLNLSSNELLSEKIESLISQFWESTVPIRTNRYVFYPKKREQLSCKLELNTKNVEFFSGSDSAIFFILAAISKSVKRILIQYPNYENYFKYAKLFDLEINKWELETFSKGFNTVDLVNTIHSYANDKLAIILTNPNGFNGKIIDIKEIENVIKCAYKHGFLVLIDLAYLTFSYQTKDDYVKLVGKYNNLILINTLSKSYGLAGERIGYVYADFQFINYLRNWNGIDSISSTSYAFANNFLNKQTDFQLIWQEIIEKREEFIATFSGNNKFEIVEGFGNFLLLSFKEEGEKQKFIKYLLTNKIVIRDLFIYPVFANCVRITIPAGHYFVILKKIIADYLKNRRL
jgi:histidinol-phosphate aminotransferase